MLMYLIIGALVFFNLMMFKIKAEDGRYGDLALDFMSFAILSAFFGQTLGGLMIIAFAGTFVTVYLFFFPPEFGY